MDKTTQSRQLQPEGRLTMASMKQRLGARTMAWALSRCLDFSHCLAEAHVKGVARVIGAGEDLATSHTGGNAGGPTRGYVSTAHSDSKPTPSQLRSTVSSAFDSRARFELVGCML